MRYAGAPPPTPRQERTRRYHTLLLKADGSSSFAKAVLIARLQRANPTQAWGEGATVTERSAPVTEGRCAAREWSGGARPRLVRGGDFFLCKGREGGRVEPHDTLLPTVGQSRWAGGGNALVWRAPCTLDGEEEGQRSAGVDDTGRVGELLGGRAGVRSCKLGTFHKALLRADDIRDIGVGPTPTNCRERDEEWVGGQKGGQEGGQAS